MGIGVLGRVVEICRAVLWPRGFFAYGAHFSQDFPFRITANAMIFLE
jgi:hypothetical protein